MNSSTSTNGGHVPSPNRHWRSREIERERYEKHKANTPPSRTPKAIIFKHQSLVAHLHHHLLHHRLHSNLITTAAAAATTSTTTGSAASSVQFRLSISDALLHYAATTNSTCMTSTELTTVTAAVARCAAAASCCNLLVFGLTHEALPALNFDGCTVILDEDEHLVLRFKQQHPGIEASNVKYETRVSEMKRLLESARDEFRGECRPVQSLLFSECKLALNSLPNHVYQLSWDVILIDGPSGHHEAAPGRMSAIFTAAVLARSKKGRAAETHVFVQDFDREVERVYSDEFLCRDNLVEVVGKLGHFVVERASDERLTTEFCRVSASANSSSSSTSMA